jgi:hypothetical protein
MFAEFGRAEFIVLSPALSNAWTAAFALDAMEWRRNWFVVKARLCAGPYVLALGWPIIRG